MWASTTTQVRHIRVSVKRIDLKQDTAESNSTKQSTAAVVHSGVLHSCPFTTLVAMPPFELPSSACSSLTDATVRLELHCISFSHYCERARWTLRLLGIKYQEVRPSFTPMCMLKQIRDALVLDLKRVLRKQHLSWRHLEVEEARASTGRSQHVRTALSQHRRNVWRFLQV